MSNACTCKAAAAGMCWLGAGQGRDISVTTTPAQDGERGDTEWNKRSKKTPSKLPVEETWTQQQHLVEPPGSSWLLLSWWDGSSQSRAELGVCACLHTPECAEPEQTTNKPSWAGLWAAGDGCEVTARPEDGLGQGQKDMSQTRLQSAAAINGGLRNLGSISTTEITSWLWDAFLSKRHS